MKTRQPDYAFSPSLLDAFERMTSTKLEEFFYQDDEGKWHLNWNEEDGTFHFSDEEVAEMLKKDFLDTVNKVEREPSEAASKGTAFNEIVDCLVMNTRSTRDDVVVRTIRNGEDLFKARQTNYKMLHEGKEDSCLSLESCENDFSKVGITFIYASTDGFEFFFDKELCLSASKYFENSMAQYYTQGLIETSKGVVELHGYIDYLRENKVFDAKTTKQYQFGNYEHKWQRYTYPYTLIESGMMDEVSVFEFTIFKLSGGSSRTPLITGEQFSEVYTYDHDRAKIMLAGQCERLIDFLEENREKITNLKVFGKDATSDNR